MDIPDNRENLKSYDLADSLLLDSLKYFSLKFNVGFAKHM